MREIEDLLDIANILMAREQAKLEVNHSSLLLYQALIFYGEGAFFYFVHHTVFVFCSLQKSHQKEQKK